MKPFEFLSHTADLKIRATGSTIEETFVHVAKAMVETLTDLNKVQKVKNFKIELKAKRIESLLYDFIDHLIFLQDTEDFLAVDFENLVIDETNFTLTGTAVGDTFGNYETFGDLKSATYHEMLIKKENNSYIIEVVIDI